MNQEINKKDKFYYAQIIPRVDVYNVLDVVVRSVYGIYFVCTEKRGQHAYLFNNTDIGNIVFRNRQDALDKVIEAEKNKIEVSNEVFMKKIRWI